MDFRWEFYLNAVKWGKSAFREEQHIRARLREVKDERDSLKRQYDAVRPPNLVELERLPL